MPPFLQLEADTATQNLQDAALVAMACITCTTMLNQWQNCKTGTVQHACPKTQITCYACL